MANEFIARKGLISSGSVNVSGSVTASYFVGDGSKLTNIGSAAIPAGTISSSTQFRTFSDPFTGSFTGSFSGNASNLSGLPTINTSLNIDTHAFTGNGSTVNYTLSSSYYNIDNLFVTVGGLTLQKTIDYTLSSNTLTFIYTPPSGSNITVKAIYSPFAVPTVSGSLIVSGALIATQNITASTITAASFTSSLASGVGFVGTASYALTASYVSGSASDWNSLANKPANLVSSSAQYPGWVTASSQIKLEQISGSTFANTDFTFPQNVTVTGTLTANEIHTVYITSSVVYETGSTKFGDASNDTHQFTGSVFMSGSLDVYGAAGLRKTNDPDLSGTSTNVVYMFDSASTSDIGNELHIRRGDRVTKWDWIEQQLNTGLLYGGVLSFSGSNSSTQLYITSGSGIIVTYSTNTGSYTVPHVKYLTWGNTTQSVTYLTSSHATYVYVDGNGTISQQTAPFTSTQYSTAIPLGRFGHANYSNVTSCTDDRYTAYGQNNQVFDFIKIFGPLKISGLTVSGQSGTLRLNVGAGSSYMLGGFYQLDPQNISHYDTQAYVTSSIIRIYTSGSNHTFDNNSGSFYTTIDPTKYAVGNGTLASVGNNNWTIQRAFFNPITGRVYVYYGQTVYASLDTAIANTSTDTFTESTYTSTGEVFVAYLIVKGNTTDLTAVDNKIVQAGTFRNSVGSSGASVFSNSLSSLSDVIITSPVVNQVLTYNGANWINSGLPSGTVSSSAQTILNISGSAIEPSTVNNLTVLGRNGTTAVGIGATYHMSGANDSNVYYGGVTAVGYNALYNNTDGYLNTAIGKYALVSNTTEWNNTAVGDKALYASTATGNTAVGAIALFGNTVGNSNTAVGDQTIYSGADGGSSAVGAYALQYATGSYNTAMGYSAGSGATGTIAATFIGVSAGNTATNASFSTFIGYNILPGTDNTYSTMIGSSAGNSSTHGTRNTIIGYGACANNSGSVDSIFIGQYAGNYSHTNTGNIYIGLTAGNTAPNNTSVVAIGNNAGQYASQSNASTFIGPGAGLNAYNSPYSTIVGVGAGSNTNNAQDSLLIGIYAGSQFDYLSTTVTGIGRNNIIIGNSITLPDGSTNMMNLGSIIFATNIYGYSGGTPSGYQMITGSNYEHGNGYGKVGINKSSPNYNLDVVGNGNFTLGVTVSGSLQASGGITGSLLGTGSWATNAVTASAATSITFTPATASYAVSASYVPSTALKTKSGVVTYTSFSGTPQIATVTFSTPFINNNYAVTVTGEDARIWTIQNKVSGSFSINSNSNTAIAGNTFWIAVANGES